MVLVPAPFTVTLAPLRPPPVVSSVTLPEIPLSEILKEIFVVIPVANTAMGLAKDSRINKNPNHPAFLMKYFISEGDLSCFSRLIVCC